MKTKTKISLGIGFLFLLIICMGAAGIFFVNQLSHDSKAIIKDNLRSLDYVEAIQQNLSKLNNTGIDMPAKTRLLDSINATIQKEAANITESGEKEAVEGLEKNFSAYRDMINGPAGTDSISDQAVIGQLQVSINMIFLLNQKAILRKNALAYRTASDAVTYISVLGTVFFLVAFVFIINFPGYIANPIRELSDKIRAIADGDFSQRLNTDPRNDEFGTVAASFNYLAKKLQEFKESNIAEITTQKSRIESIVNNLEEAIILLNERREIVVVNPLAADLLGVKAASVIGHAADVVAGKNDLFRALIKDFPEGSSEDKMPVRITFDGEENYFQKYFYPVYQYDEWKQETKPGGYVIVLKNITEFKKLDMARTNFMATISHELKTPLSSINLSLKLMQDERIGTLSAEQLQLADNIRHENQRLLKYVNELLDFSQIESGNIRLNMTKADPSSIVNLSLEAMKPTLEQKHLHTETVIEENLPLVNADVEKTTWVLTNLLSNAARFSAEGGKIIVSATRSPEGRVRFSVKDNGPGIDPRYHEKIFERFVQVYSHGNKGGTGLGLAIAKDFIEAQHGKIWVNSVVGEGSEFVFEMGE